MAEKKSTSKPTLKETPKQNLSRETAEAIATAKTSIERFSKMMEGLDGFISHVEGDDDASGITFGVSYIADLIMRDDNRIAENLGKLLEQ